MLPMERPGLLFPLTAFPVVSPRESNPIPLPLQTQKESGDGFFSPPPRSYSLLQLWY